MNSLLVLKDTNEYIDIYDYAFLELIDSKLAISDKDNDKIVFDAIIKNIKDLNDLLNANPRFKLLIKIATDNENQIPLNTVLTTVLSYNELSIKDIMYFYRSRKGYDYIEGVPTLVDYIVNIINYKIGDYNEAIKLSSGSRLTLQQYLYDIKEEIAEVKYTSEFIQQFTKSIGKFNFLVGNLLNSISNLDKS